MITLKMHTEFNFVVIVPSKIYPGSKLVKVSKKILKVYIFCNFTKIKIS